MGIGTVSKLKSGVAAKAQVFVDKTKPKKAEFYIAITRVRYGKFSSK